MILFSAQSMSRAAAGAFAYAPFAHGMWGFSNTSSATSPTSQKYSAGGSGLSSSSSNTFGYPPTPPKDSGTPEQNLNDIDHTTAAQNGYSHHMNNNNNLVSSGATMSTNTSVMTGVGAGGLETKPSTEHLMSSISSLSAYAGLPSSASRKLPEGTTSAGSITPSSQQYSSSSPTEGAASASVSAVAAQAAAAASNSMFYYPTTSDLAMYGSGSYGNRALQSSRPKSKNRSNAGKPSNLVVVVKILTFTLVVALIY